MPGPGRYKDMLILVGEVDPYDVEPFDDPSRSSGAVVGMPDARLSEVAVA